MAAQNPTRRTAILLVVLLCGQLILMTGSARDTEGATVLESWTIYLTSPFVGLARAAGGGFGSLMTGAKNLVASHARNRALESEVERLREELRRYREAAFENNRLRRLLELKEEKLAGSIAAAIVTSHQTDQAKLLVVDRGKRDGIRAEAPVIALGAAVGRVVDVYERHSKVRLLTDPNSGVAGAIQRNRAQGIVVGQGDQPLELLYVPRFTDVGAGDLVVTSALDGIFPRGFEIGRVVDMSESPSGTQTIYLEPVLDYGALEEVLILPEAAGGGLVPAPDPAGVP